MVTAKGIVQEPAQSLEQPRFPGLVRAKRRKKIPTAQSDRRLCTHFSPKEHGPPTQRVAQGTNTIWTRKPTVWPCIHSTNSPLESGLRLAWPCLHYPMGLNSCKREHDPAFRYKHSYDFTPVPSGRQRNQTAGPQWIPVRAPVSQH